ncbi:uncharacterized protein CTHT_0053650 [Thermochaetoides thermophila DSM 1495]|uniref:Uncharacterized protein n=1 Tax=Chaetomium thermophilum (strain DSM 1495 / CBS 144.50 / IMI 039719) TaxID=759272 RepID=G0SBI0_CHATD|nr:hypothetical protein CTHT_0053650 [Thermochaetoides thermophila DSM 1495]EGS18756.1 hypothetical protein CTHT_0053650 [Thermochaetoides thermophila DSM 1495]
MPRANAGQPSFGSGAAFLIDLATSAGASGVHTWIPATPLGQYPMSPVAHWPSIFQCQGRGRSSRAATELRLLPQSATFPRRSSTSREALALPTPLSSAKLPYEAFSEWVDLRSVPAAPPSSTLRERLPAMKAPMSKCCRSLQRPVVAPNLQAYSVWITDSLLVSAFDRYCSVSRAWNRSLSHIPGPLESQRRLGKRRMGDASTQLMPPTPAPWMFPVPLDLSHWTWQPPSLWSSSPAEHNRSRFPYDDIGVADLVRQWLGPQQRLVDDFQEFPAVPETLDIPVTDTAQVQASLEFDMSAVRLAVQKRRGFEVKRRITAIAKKLRQHIYLGLVPSEKIYSLVVELFAITESSVCPYGRKAALDLCWAIVRGSATSSVFSPTMLDPRLWNTMLLQLSRKPFADDELCRVVNYFADALEVLPETDRPPIAEGLLRLLSSFFSTWAGADKKLVPFNTMELLLADAGLHCDPENMPWLLRHPKTVVRMLQLLPQQEVDSFLHQANQLVLEQASKMEKSCRTLRSCWLLTLAQLPNVSETFFFDSIVALSQASLPMKPITATELCALIFLHWRSHGYLASEERCRVLYNAYRRGPNNTAFARLLAAIGAHWSGTPDHVTKLYTSCWTLMAKLGRTREVFWSLRHYTPSKKVTKDMLQQLALVCDNHRMAIRLKELYWRKLRKPGTPDRFDPGVFEKYIDAIVLDPRLPPRMIWRALGIYRMDGRKTTLAEKLQHQRGAYGQQRAELAAKVSDAFVKATHISDRVAFRHVSQCYLFIRAIKREPPIRVIENIYRVVIRDMQRHQPGRTKRLLWFLSIVERHYGIQIAFSCRLILRQWRSRLKRWWLSMGYGEARF